MFTLLFCQQLCCQTDNFNISLISAIIDPDLMGGVKLYGAENEEKDKLVSLYLKVKIDGFNETSPVDFNNFSLVETKNKLRHRPFFVGFRRLFLLKFDIEYPGPDDPFLKYSHPDFENYDHYYIQSNGFKKSTKSKQRFCLTTIPVKKNKKKEFFIHFPIKIRKEGEFILYYKNQIIKTFIADKTLKKFKSD